MYKYKKKLFWALSLSFLCSTPAVATEFKNEITHTSTQDSIFKIRSVEKLNATTIEIRYSNKQSLLVDFYGNNIFRLFMDNKSSLVRDPKASPAAKILVDNPRKEIDELKISDNNESWRIHTPRLTIEIDKKSSLINIVDTQTNKTVLETINPVEFNGQN